MTSGAGDIGFKVTTEPGDGLSTIFLEGELTITTCQQFIDASDRLVSEGVRAMAIDASRLTFMDSTGLNGIVSLLRQGRKTGLTLAFSGFNGAPRRVLELTHMDMLMDLHETLDQARQALASK